MTHIALFCKRILQPGTMQTVLFELQELDKMQTAAMSPGQVCFN